MSRQSGAAGRKEGLSMFCVNCGAPLPPDGRFCPACGQSAPQAPASASLYQTYVQNLSAYLRQDPLYIPELKCVMFLTQRFSKALCNMHQYFFLLDGDEVNGMWAQQFSQACTHFALHNYKGVPRGLQKAVVVYPVICQTRPNPEVMAFVQQPSPDHFAAFEFPILLDLTGRQLTFCTTTKVWGFAMQDGIRKAAWETLTMSGPQQIPAPPPNSY